MGETKKQQRERERREQSKYLRQEINLKGMLEHARTRTVTREWGDYLYPHPLETSFDPNERYPKRRALSDFGQSRGGVEFDDGSMIACVIIPAWDYSELTPGDDAQVEFFLLTPNTGQNDGDQTE